MLRWLVVWGASFLIFRIAAHTITTFGAVGTSTYKWRDGVLAPNGLIYGIPYFASTVLKIDPEQDTATTFGEVGTSNNKWAGGVLAVYPAILPRLRRRPPRALCSGDGDARPSFA